MFKILKLCSLFLSVIIWLPFVQVNGSDSSSLDFKNISFEEKKLFVPSIEDLQKALEIGLKLNFHEVMVEIVDSMNFKEDPYNLASDGINGDPVVIEYGQNSYFYPHYNKSKIYDLVPMVKNIKGYEDKEFLTFGGGPGDFTLFNQSCEGSFNMKILSNNTILNEGYLAKINNEVSMDLVKLKSIETRGTSFGNLFVSEGKPGIVLKITCRYRFGKDNIVVAMRKSLIRRFPGKTIGLGGVFVINNGSALIHVVDDKLMKIPKKQLSQCLQYFNMTAPLTGVGTLVTNDAGLKLERLEHFHIFSQHGKGGHYHYDVTPDTVEYEGYFIAAEKIVRIDRSSPEGHFLSNIWHTTVVCRIWERHTRRVRENVRGILNI